MIAIWQFYWPAIVAAAVIGAVAGVVGFRPSKPGQARRQRHAAIAGGALLALAAILGWHGPLQAGGTMAAAMERVARVELVRLEMGGVEARLATSPLSRDLRLSGLADDFQRSELVRILDAVPGVRSVEWADAAASNRGRIPLYLEVAGLGLLGFGLGLLLSYLIELRRRARRDWRW